jgi:hypothetical protein
MKALLPLADTANGVQVVDIVDYPESELLNAHEFVMALSDLKDGEEVFCSVIEGGMEFEYIQNTYGVRV